MSSKQESGVTRPTKDEHQSWLYRLGVFVTSPRGRWITVATWLVAIVLLVALPTSIRDLYDNQVSSDNGDTESRRAGDILKQSFPQAAGLPAIIVFNNPSGLTASDLAQAKKVSDWLTSTSKPEKVESVVSLETVPQARSELLSANNTTLQIVVALKSATGQETELGKTVEEIRKYVKPLNGNGLEIHLTGPAGVIADTISIFESTDLPLLLTTVGLVLVLLLVVYRSPLLAITPLVIVFVAIEAVNGLLSLAVQAKLFSVSQQSSSILSVLLFGVGVDYTIFLVSRYREELQREPNRLIALRRAYGRVAEAILSSAGTVIAALLTLLLATLGLYRSLGPTLAVGVAVMLLVGLTLVPALLAIVGRAAFWPFVPKLVPVAEVKATRRSIWHSLATGVAKRPAKALWASTLILFVMGLGNLGVIDVFNFLSGFRQPTDSAQGYKVLAANFGAGRLATTDVVIALPNGLNAYDQLVTIEKVSQSVAAVPNVALVKGPTRPNGAGQDAASLSESFKRLPEPLKAAIRQGQGLTATSADGQSGINPATIGAYAQTLSYISADNRVVRLSVTLNSDPYGKAGLDTIAPIRETVRQNLAQAGLGQDVLLAGVTAENADIREVNNRDKLVVIPVAVALTTIILIMLLRSLVAPFYLIIAVLLNFFATLGAASFVWVVLQGDEGRAYSIPLYAFIFLVSLGADYTIFLMTRVREEVAANGLEEGTIRAVSSTGGVITSAGLILAGTFLVLTILPLRELYQLGFVVALGILLDTFVVRGIVVPVTVLLCKDLNWWPSKLATGSKPEVLTVAQLLADYDNKDNNKDKLEKAG